MFASIRFRLTLLFVLIFGTMLIAFSVAMFHYYRQVQEEEFDRTLFNYAVDISEAIDFNLFGDIKIIQRKIFDERKVLPFSLGQVYLQIRNPSGQIISKSSSLKSLELPLGSDELKSLYNHGNNFLNVHLKELLDHNRPLRMINYLINKGPFNQIILQVAVPMDSMRNERKSIQTIAGIFIPLTLMLATIGGLFFSARALDPLKKITQTVEAIQANQLSERIPLSPRTDEFYKLATSLNALLTRLERAFESQDQFIADTSHQLKTPLAILHGQLDLLKSRPRDFEESTKFIVSAIQEVEHLDRMIDDLLLLARVESGETIQMSPLRPDEILIDVVSRLKPVAKNKNIQVKLEFNIDVARMESEDIEIFGEEELLSVLFANLIENAIKYSPVSSVITVSIARPSKNQTVISVKDAGPGIDDQKRKRIFDRFYRGVDDKENIPGLGIGLSIVQRIVQAHNAQLDVKSENGQGSEFSVYFKSS